MMKKDQLTREWQWREGTHYLGVGLVGRTFGLIGLGNIGREVIRLISPLSVRHLAYDPFLDPVKASAASVEVVSLDELLSRSDFVCVTCPLTEAPEDRIFSIDGFLLENIDSGSRELGLRTFSSRHGWTDQFGALTGVSGTDAVRTVARGKRPRFLVNKVVMADPRLKARMRRHRERFCAFSPSDLLTSSRATRRG